ncbi:BTB/POZ domain-containing protein 1 [Octopus sinensis]|nr:BTB/POZ domain-containing protein 1 [Octopus sinensis]
MESKVVDAQNQHSAAVGNSSRNSNSSSSNTTATATSSSSSSSNNSNSSGGGGGNNSNIGVNNNSSLGCPPNNSVSSSNMNNNNNNNNSCTNTTTTTTTSNSITNQTNSCNKKNREVINNSDDQCSTISSSKIDNVCSSSDLVNTARGNATPSKLQKPKSDSNQTDCNKRESADDKCESSSSLTNAFSSVSGFSQLHSTASNDTSHLTSCFNHCTNTSVSNSNPSHIYPCSYSVPFSDSNTHRPISGGASANPSVSRAAGNSSTSGGPYNWQASKISVRERLAYLYNNDVMSDVKFRVGKAPDSQIIPAHKFVLSVGSAVFDALFNWMKTSNYTHENLIEIPDVEPSAFLALLRFLYCDEVQINPETVMTTLYAAKKYSVPALEKECVEFLKGNLSSDNAFLLLSQARLFDESHLASLCLETIDKNTSEALAAEGFTDIDLDTMAVVLERDSLGIRECKLFTAVCRWAEAECIRQNLTVTPANQRKVLGKALHLIRFPLMSVEEFARDSAQSGILLDREVVDLFLYFISSKPTSSFSDVPRCSLTGKEQVISRFCQIESRWGYSGTSDRIRFMVNRRIFVVGFGLYGSIHGPTDYLVNIELLHADTGKVLGQNNGTFHCDGSTSTFRVLFKKPLEVLPNVNYTACTTLKGPDSYYGSRGLRRVTHETVSSGKVTFQFTYATGNNNGTSIEDGQIPEIIFYT